MKRRSIKAVCIFFLIALSSAGIAHEEEVLFNKVHLQASAEREIPNDEMQVLLVTEHQGSKPDQLADAINRDMAWALAEAKKYKTVDSSTRSYRTHPVYKNRVITAWQASQELALKSGDFTEMTKLIGKLQEKLQVRQMTFNPTRSNRSTYENELIEEAMQAFRQRVEIVKGQMEQENYRIVDINVHTNDHVVSPVRFQRAEMAALSVASPQVEAGTSKVVVTVSGSVQFY